MKQQEMFTQDYDIDDIRRTIMLHSDLRDMLHAANQGLLGIVNAMAGLENPQVPINDILSIVDANQTLMEDSTFACGQLLTKAVYRGEE